MKVKFGAIVVDGRNKIGGHVMSKNRAGAYMRTKVSPVNPRSLDQLSNRARLSAISSSWDSLSQAEIAAWNAAVTEWSHTDIFGDIKHPSGFNLFQKLHNNILRSGGGVTDTPPTKVTLSNLISLSVGSVTSLLIPLTTGLQTLAQDEVVEILATPTQNVGKSFVKSEYRIIESSATLTAGAVDVGAQYIAKFGSINSTTGKFFIQARIINQNTGQVGIPITAVFVAS